MTEELARKLESFSQIVWERNRFQNLVGYRDLSTFKKEAVEDSLTAIKTGVTALDHLPGKILDVGSGAGIPGIIAALSYPESLVTLIESNKKKSIFLSEAASELALSNCQTLNIRIETFKDFEKYDLAFCKAVAELSVSLEYTVPFLKKSGIFLAQKGRKSNHEINSAKNAMKLLGVILDSSHTCGEKNYLAFRKISETPAGYPRKTGVPAKRPL